MEESNSVIIYAIKIWIIRAKSKKTNNIILEVFQSLIEEDVKLFI